MSSLRFSIGQQAAALLPDGDFFCALRRRFYARHLRKAGRFAALSGLKIFSCGNVSIGDDVHINLNVLIDAGGGEIEIGDNVLIGPYCVLRAADHRFSDPKTPIRLQGHEGGRIVIEED